MSTSVLLLLFRFDPQSGFDTAEMEPSKFWKKGLTFQLAWIPYLQPSFRGATDGYDSNRCFSSLPGRTKLLAPPFSAASTPNFIRKALAAL